MMQMLAIDLGKQWFHIHGIDEAGVVVSRKASRGKLLAVVVDALAPKIAAMEACATSHHWGRTFQAAADRRIRPMNPRFVRPFARGSKNDAIDAEATFEAASHPTMPYVSVKSLPQQELRSLHGCATDWPRSAPR